jgi:hypothetical protein
LTNIALFNKNYPLKKQTQIFGIVVACFVFGATGSWRLVEKGPLITQVEAT